MSDVRRNDRWVPVAAWTGMAVVVTAIRYLASNRGRSPIGVWLRVDGFSYMAIAGKGYSYSRSAPYPIVAWFPGYPLTIRWLGALVGTQLGAAVAISFASGLAVAVLFWEWTRPRLGDTERMAALAALLVYAYGWYLYGAVYSDALYLALALGAFVAVDRGLMWWAVVLAGAASGVRPIGFAVGVALVILVLERDGVLGGRATAAWAARCHLPERPRLRQLRWRHLGLLVASMWGVIAYSTYLAVRWGQPLLWIDVQKRWSQGPSAGPQSWFKFHMVARMIRIHEADYVASNLVQLAIMTAIVLAIPAIIGRFGLAYGVYVAIVSAIIVFGANDMVGAGRYAIGVFPVAALLGRRLAHRPAEARWYFAASGIGLLVLTVLFARGAYLT
ncbi:MAG: hypothetical protein U0Q22_02490 [Acidimicrobiales bacterium]